MNQQRRDSAWWRGNISLACSGNVQVYNNISVISSHLRMDGGSTDWEPFSHNTAIGAFGNKSGDMFGANYVFFNNLTYDVNNPTSNSICTENVSVEIAGTHGNLCAKNPLFLKAGSNFHLQSSSSAINAGTSVFGIPSIDLDGTARPDGAAVDIGCYEYTGAAPLRQPR